MRTTLKLIGLTLAAGMLTAGDALAQTLPSHPPVNFTTGSPTGTWFPVAAAVAELTNAKYQGQPISITPSAGGVGSSSRSSLNVASGCAATSA